jgi:hypothetical protein
MATVVGRKAVVWRKAPRRASPHRGATAPFREKQKTYLESDANLVVIDLLRCGHLVIPVPDDAIVESAGNGFSDSGGALAAAGAGNPSFWFEGQLDGGWLRISTR